MILPGPWSFSGLKRFKQCAKQYYEVKVAKNFKEPESTEATLYGKEYHAAAEHYIQDSKPLPLHFSYTKPHLDILKNIPGIKYCEYEMGLREDLTPCGFRDEGVWCRGIADLLIIDEDKGVARCVDYKTGKSSKYADSAQLELMALMIFKHFPKIRTVKAGLLFVVTNEFKPSAYFSDQEHTYWRVWMQDVNRLEVAHTSGVWNPNKSGLCKAHCVVTNCHHNGKFRG